MLHIKVVDIHCFLDWPLGIFHQMVNHFMGEANIKLLLAISLPNECSPPTSQFLNPLIHTFARVYPIIANTCNSALAQPVFPRMWREVRITACCNECFEDSRGHTPKNKKCSNFLHHVFSKRCSKIMHLTSLCQKTGTCSRCMCA